MKALTQRLDQNGHVISSASVLPSGPSGTQKTLSLMRESVIASLTSDALLSAAFIAAGLANRAASDRAEVERVQQWVQKSIRYVLDPRQVELLQSPELTLQRRQGDCDDQTSLTCALLTALGYQCRMAAIGFAPNAYAHVYSEVLIDGVWTACETIKPWPLGKSPDGVKAQMRFVIAAPDLQRAPQLNGLFKSIKKAVTKVVTHPIKLIKDPIGTIKADLKAIPGTLTAAASGFSAGGPWGAVAAVAVSKVQQAHAQLAAKKLDAKAQAEFAQIATETGQQLADAAGQPGKAAEYATRIKAAADPQAEVEKIIGEFQAAALVPKASSIAATDVAAVAKASTGNTVTDFIANHKVAVAIGGTVLVSALIFAAFGGQART